MSLCTRTTCLLPKLTNLPPLSLSFSPKLPDLPVADHFQYLSLSLFSLLKMPFRCSVSTSLASRTQKRSALLSKTFTHIFLSYHLFFFPNSKSSNSLRLNWAFMIQLSLGSFLKSLRFRGIKDQPFHFERIGFPTFC